LDTRYSPDGLIEDSRYADTFGFDADDNWREWAGRENILRLNFMGRLVSLPSLPSFLPPFSTKEAGEEPIRK